MMILEEMVWEDSDALEHIRNSYRVGWEGNNQ